MKKKTSLFITKFRQLHQAINRNPQKDYNYLEIAFLFEKKLSELKHKRQKRRILKITIVVQVIFLFLGTSLFFYMHQPEKLTNQPSYTHKIPKTIPAPNLQEPNQPFPQIVDRKEKSKDTIQPSPTQPKKQELIAFKENEYFEELVINSKSGNSLFRTRYIFGEQISLPIKVLGEGEYNLIIYNNLGDIAIEKTLRVNTEQLIQVEIESTKLGLGVFYFFVENELEDFSCKLYILEE